MRLRDLLSLLEQVTQEQWTEGHILALLQSYIEDQDIGFGAIGAPLRASLTAGNPSPDLAIVLSVLGKDETLGRIEDCLQTSFSA